MSANNVTTFRVQMDDGVNLHVKLIEDKTDSRATKPLLISLHGAPGLSTHLEPAASFSHLSNLFRVLVFDARGSGASDLIGPYTHDRWVKDVENLRRWADAETFVLAGASYGGFVALDYAILHSERLRGLILRDTWAHGLAGMMTGFANVLLSNRIKPDIARQVRVFSGTLIDDKDFEDAVMELLPFYAPPEEANLVPTEKKPESTEFKGSVSFHSATQNYAFGVNLPKFDVRSQLHKIKAPTLVIVGRHDHMAPMVFSEEIAIKIPRARLEIFEHSGHSPPSDEPERFEEVLMDFLKDEIL